MGTFWIIKTWRKCQFFGGFEFLLLSYFMLMTMEACPDVCRCSEIKFATNKQDVLRVVCSSVKSLYTISDSLIQLIPNSTVQLIMRENMFTVIPSFGFVNFPVLKKLDLSRNNISEIQVDAFANLSTLEKLDLSHNKISSLSSNVFHPLIALLRLDLSNNQLNCDCHFKWFIEWYRSKKVHIPSKTTCYFPKALEGHPLVRIAKKELHCDLPMFELYPSVPQLVFEGDSFSLQCRVSKDHNVDIMWMLNDNMLSGSPEQRNIGVTVNTSTDINLIYSSLRIGEIKSIHAGFWRCFANSRNDLKSLSVELLVLSNDGEFCSRSTSYGNRGNYEWPETPVGITVEMECSSKRSSQLDLPGPFAYHTCSRLRIWQNLNTSACPYISEVTNVLEQFAKSNISFSPANAVDSARLLQNYTKEKNLLADKMDVVFISRILQSYLHAVPHSHEVADIIVDIINTLMYLDKDVLNAAELEDQACTRVLSVIEGLSELLMDLPLNHITGNIVIEDFFIKSGNFQGITCFSFLKNNYFKHGHSSEAKKNPNKKFLNCNIASFLEFSERDDSIEASLQLPSTIFQHSALDSLSTATYKLQFVIFRNDMLFPRTITQHEMSDVTSSIISGKIEHRTFHNLSEPVIVSLRTAAYTDDVKPVWWDSSAMGGRGDWSDDGCSVIKVHSNIVTFTCNRLATFGLLQNIDSYLAQYSFEKARFHFPHPAIFIGSMLCITTLIVTLIFYGIAYKSLRIPDRAKHSTANTYLSLLLLCLTFILGIHQKDIIPICQGIGFLLHYFTLCTLFWMVVTASNLYKKLSKSELPDTTSSENLPTQTLPPKPMLRFYLVGWGISSIITGISAAVDIDNYGGVKFCFLSFSQSLGALYGPSLFLLFLLCFLYLHIYCSIQHKYLDENFNVGASIQPFNTHSSAVYNERSNSYEEESIQSYELQLRGNATLLLMYIVTWLTAYSSIGRPFEGFLSHDELLFSLLYCVFSSIMAIYSFVYFCCLHSDIRKCFHIFHLCKKPAEKKDIAETFSMMENSNKPIQNTVKSDDEGNSLSEDVTICAVDSAESNEISTKITSDNNTINNINIFYNPRQNELARRFFEKNRRQQKNDLELCTKGKLERKCFENFIESSNSSQNNHKSECFNDNKSLAGSDPFHPSERNLQHKTASSQSEILSLKCQCFRKNLCHSPLSDSHQKQNSAVCHRCCSNIGSDVFSNTIRPHRQNSWKHHGKCCHSKYSTCTKANKTEEGCSYSAEDLKYTCQCLYRPYTKCYKSSNNMYNLHSNSEITVMYCKCLKEE